MNLIQISKYSLVQDLSNDIPSGCITVIGHDLIEKFAIFAHQLVPKCTLRSNPRWFYLRKLSPLCIEFMCKVSYFYRKVHIIIA